jgi:seryl-tRNA synthetase
MAEMAPGVSDSCRTWTEQLVAHGVLISQGVNGLQGHGALMEDVIERFDRLVTAAGAAERPDIMRFPPVINRRHFERSGYLRSFPNLVGSVHSFDGGDRDHAELLQRMDAGDDWSHCLPGTGVVLAPAACYPVYPTLTGTLPAAGRTVDVASYVYRHEPSDDPARMQMFRQREYVRIGTEAQCRSHADQWEERGLALLRALGLPAGLEEASDPFFGRAGRMMALNQRDQRLKVELVVPICSDDKPTACASCNYHQEHFGQAFDIRTADGAIAHSACVAFGLERIALALFKHHGFQTGNWPVAVRQRLGL